jgi:purine nucleosidase
MPKTPKRGLIKRFIRTIVIAVLFVLLAYMIVSNIAFFQRSGGTFSEKVIIDTDSGNDMDDLFAIVRALTDPDMKIIGLISSHWNFHEQAQDSSVMISQKINEKILTLLNLTNIAHPTGAVEMIRFDGNPIPQPSDGAKFIIDNASGLPSGEKLKVIILGSATNLASAILMDSSIITKLDCYILGLKYDYLSGTWNKNEFNTRCDLDGMDLILNLKDLEVTVMTSTISKDLIFRREETFDKLRNKGDIWNWLLENWDKNYHEHTEWIMQDVALMEAIIHPRFAIVKEVYTPPENTRRKIKVFTKIKTEAMIKDYWKAVNRAAGF